MDAYKAVLQVEKYFYATIQLSHNTLRGVLGKMELDDLLANRDIFFPSRRRHTRLVSDWSSDVCSSDLTACCSTRSSSPSPGSRTPTSSPRRSSSPPA